MVVSEFEYLKLEKDNKILLLSFPSPFFSFPLLLSPRAGVQKAITYGLSADLVLKMLKLSLTPTV